MLFRLKIFFIVFSVLFFLLPNLTKAEETIIDGAVLYQYQATQTDGTSFLKAKNGIIYPKDTDKIEEIYLFLHGFNPPPPCDDCHFIGPMEACQEFKLCEKVALRQQLTGFNVGNDKKNIAIFIPQMDPKSGNHRSSFTKQQFDNYLNEALAQLHSKISDSPNTISVIAGHSAGAGLVIRFSDFLPSLDKALIFDGCYSTWCKTIIGSSKIKKKQIYIATTNNYDTNANLAEVSGMDGAVVKISAQHYQVPDKCFLDHITNAGCNGQIDNKTKEIDQRITQINARKPTFEIDIPGLNLSDVASIRDDTGTYIFIPWIPQFISAIYKFAVGVVSIVAVIMIVLAGVRIITSSVSGEGTAESYKKITHALIGLLIAWGSFAILYNINPSLVEFNALKVRVVDREELPVSPSDEEPTDIGDLQIGSSPVPYFGQYDKKWANIKPGAPEWPFDTTACTKGATTILQRGCGATSLAMVLKYLGKDVTPIDTAKFVLGCTGPMNGSKTKESWGNGPWSDLKFDFFFSSQASQGEQALNIAAKNIPLIFNCHPCVGYTGDGSLKTYSGHYMVITGSDDGGKTFKINDPGGNPNKNNAIIKMTREQILNPQQDEAIAGCKSKENCIKGLDKIRKPPFIYIHK